MTYPADQPSIQDIIDTYLDPEDMPGGMSQYFEMLDRLLDRDRVMASDSFLIGKRNAYREMRQIAQKAIDSLPND